MPELGAVIADFMADAETGDAYPRAQLRELRAALAHVVASDLSARDVGAVRARHVYALAEELRAAGVSASRTDGMVDALRLVFAYAAGRGLIRSSPLVGSAPTGAGPPSPTTALLAFGERLATWIVRGAVVAFVLTSVALVVALA